jgi:gluconolactonase
MLMPPRQKALSAWTRIPDRFAAPRRSAWADLYMGGRSLGCFLEGPVFDAGGNLLVADIPFGRVFRIDAAGEWTLIAEYDGWPNGMRWWNGRLMVADHKRGLVALDPVTGRHEVILSSIGGAPFLGLNDLATAPDGALYFTDQGESGLHAPEGRVLRLRPDGTLDTILDNGPSPNGIVFDAQRGWLHVAMTRGNCVWRVPLVAGRPSKVGVAIQLSGGIGPDGLALDPAGHLLVAHPPIGVWRFDRNNLPACFFAAPDDGYVTNLALAPDGRIFVTDSIAGRILVAALEDAA